MDIVLPTRRYNINRGISGSTSERVGAIRIDSKDAGITVEAHLGAELPSVCSVHVGETLTELKQVSEAARGGPGRGVIRLVKTVREGHARLCVIGRVEDRRTADVTEGSLGYEVRRDGSRVAQRGVTLVVQKKDCKTWVDGRLAGVGERPVHIVEV